MPNAILHFDQSGVGCVKPLPPQSCEPERALLHYDRGRLCPPGPTPPEMEAEKLRELLTDIALAALSSVTVTNLDGEVTDQQIPTAAAVVCALMGGIVETRFTLTADGNLVIERAEMLGGITFALDDEGNLEVTK